MSDLASLIKEYGFIVVLAVFFILAALHLFRANQAEKQALQKTIDENNERNEARLSNLETFQREELVKMQQQTVAVLEQTQHCLKDTADAVNKFAEILIVERAKNG